MVRGRRSICLVWLLVGVGVWMAGCQSNSCPLPCRPLAVGSPGGGSEEYVHYPENKPVDAGTASVSTFSVDVDTASYTNMRRYLTTEGALPPVDAVRIEEFLNYFKYAYPEPVGSAPIGVTTEMADCPWAQGHQLLRIAVKARTPRNLPPCHLVFLIDTSGSMASDEKLPLLKEAFRALVKALRPQDRIAIVTYAGTAGICLGPTEGKDRETISKALEGLQAVGSTAGGEGLALAYRVAETMYAKDAVNRVILATDGDFNVGTSGDDELVQFIEKKRETGVYLSVLEVGRGNNKDAKMQRLADSGNGNAAYVDNLREGERVLVQQMSGTLVPVADDVKIQVRFNPRDVAAYRLLGYEKRALKARDFKDDKKDAGEMGAGQTVTAMYELLLRDRNDDGKVQADFVVVPKTGEEAREGLATVALRYKRPGEKKIVEMQVKVSNDKITRAMKEASTDFRFAAAVAQFALLLRDSKFSGTATWANTAELARGALGDDPDGQRHEFVRLVDSAIAIQIKTGGQAGQ